MPLIGRRASLAAAAYGFITAVRTKITDTFTRSSGSTLGSADTGQPWSTLAGSWGTNGTQAYSSTDGSVAVVPYNQDATVSADVSPGVGLTFWASAAGSFWAVVPYYAQTSYTYTGCCTTSSCHPAPCTPSNCCSSPVDKNWVSYTWSCSTGGLGSGGGIVPVGTTCATEKSATQSTYCPSGVLTFNCSEEPAKYCDSASSTNCTAPRSNTYARIYDKNTNTSTDLDITYNNGASNYTTLGSMVVTTSGNGITVTAYTGAGKSGTSYNAAHNPTSPTKGSKVGVYRTSGGTVITQGTTLDNFEAS